jgi:hypothetical protein
MEGHDGSTYWKIQGYPDEQQQNAASRRNIGTSILLMTIQAFS